MARLSEAVYEYGKIDDVSKEQRRKGELRMELTTCSSVNALTDLDAVISDQ